MKLPEHWGEVPLKKYQELSEISLVDMDEVDKMVKILAVLSGEKEDDVMNLTLPQIKQATSSVQFVFSQPEKSTLKLKPVIKLLQKRYLVNMKLNTLTGGEYIDLSEYTKDPKAITPNLHHIVSIFLHPVNIFGRKKLKNYVANANNEHVQSLTSRNLTAELVKEEMMMDDVFAMSGFFLKVWEGLMQTTQLYLMEVANKQKKEIIKGLDL